jgi:hypothetical protein
MFTKQIIIKVLRSKLVKKIFSQATYHFQIPKRILASIHASLKLVYFHGRLVHFEVQKLANFHKQLTLFKSQKNI